MVCRTQEFTQLNERYNMVFTILMPLQSTSTHTQRHYPDYFDLPILLLRKVRAHFVSLDVNLKWCILKLCDCDYRNHIKNSIEFTVSHISVLKLTYSNGFACKRAVHWNDFGQTFDASCSMQNTGMNRNDDFFFRFRNVRRIKIFAINENFTVRSRKIECKKSIRINSAINNQTWAEPTG